jgi:ribosomal protein L7/L12
MQMQWAREFWDKIFPHHKQNQREEYDSADVILESTGNNISHLNHVLCSMTGFSSSEIKFYLEKTPVVIFSLPKSSAIEIANVIQTTGATVSLRFYNKI